MSKIDVAANIKKLQLAKQLVESAYHDLKNVSAFREAGDNPDRIVVTEIYGAIMVEIADLIAAAQEAL